MEKNNIQTKLESTYTGVSFSVPQEFEGTKFYGFGTWVTAMQGIFSIDYSITHENKILTHFNVILSDKETIELEEVLKREKKTRRIRSETIYNGSVYMSCIVGNLPIISFAEKGVSISFAKDKDYDILLEKVTTFLNEKKLEPELLELRKEWEKDFQS